MKKLILVIAMGLAGANSFADTTTAISGASSVATTESTSVAGAAVVGSGNSAQGQKQGQKQGQDQLQGQGQQQGIKDSGNASQGQKQAIKDSGNSSATAGNNGQEQGIKDSGNSSATSAANGGSVTGTSATLDARGAVQVGCLVNCADQSSAAKEAGAADIQVALINSAAAKEIARTTQTIKNTPSVNGPQLVTSNDTCMGSTSGSANVPGIGIGFGTSWVDTNCKMLKNSRELWNMGMKGAAMALMCKDPDNREALELTGFECPQTTRDNARIESRKVVDAQPAEITDPIVRARLGMPALTASAK